MPEQETQEQPEPTSVEDGEQDGSEPETEPESESSTGGCPSCGTPEDEVMVVKDRNLDYPWKGGNPYSRVCPNCGSRTFTAKTYWQTQEVPLVIPKGEDEPVPLFGCPYEGCDGELLGMVDECPECERQIEWEEPDGDSE